MKPHDTERIPDEMEEKLEEFYERHEEIRDEIHTRAMDRAEDLLEKKEAEIENPEDTLDQLDEACSRIEDMWPQLVANIVYVKTVLQTPDKGREAQVAQNMGRAFDALENLYAHARATEDVWLTEDMLRDNDHGPSEVA